jgi:hypothetical protein
MVKPIDTGANDTPVFTGQVGGPAPSTQMLSPSIAGAAYEGLGKMAEQLSDIGNKMLLPEMADKGAQAVTRDPGTGELSVHTRVPLNDLDVAYNHAAQAAFLTQSEGDRRSALQQLAIDHIDDPAAFNELATKYVKTQAGGAGVPTGLRGDILNTGLHDVQQFTSGLVTKKQERDTKNQFDTINAGIRDTSNDIYALAHQGGTQTPDFAAAVGKLQNQLNTLGGNPLFKMSPAEIEEKKSQILSSAEGEATLGHALQMAKDNGSDAGLAFLQKAVWDPKLNLTPSQRETFEHRGTAEIHQWDASNRAANTQLKQVVIHNVDDAVAMAKATGKQDVLSNDQIDSAFKDDPARAQDIHNAINGAATTYSMNAQVTNATPAFLAELEHRYNPANTPPTKAGFDAFYSGFLAPHEKGFAAHDGSANAGPVNGGVNQDANPDLNVRGLTPAEQKQVLHDRYWTASGADALPPQLAAVVGDTAVNMGVQRSKDLLAKSGGDAGKYLDLRAQAYKDIAAANPDKAANLPEWLKRNDDLRGYIGAGSAGGGGFADRERTYTAFLTAVHQRNEQLGKDPAAYTASVRPDIQANLQSDDPNAVQHGVRSSIQAQRDFGVGAPKVLSVGQAQAIVQQFNNPQDPTKRADAMNQTIDGLAQRYGTYFPQVMQELQTKGMPPEASSLYAVRGLGVPAVRMATAINSMSRMGKDLNEGRDKFFANAPNNSEIRKAIPGVMGDYAGTLQANADGPQQTDAMTNAVSLYARQLAYEGVTDPNKAAQKAHDDLIGSRYNFVDNYRVPKGIDQSMIQAGANTVQLGLSASNMEPYASAAPGVSTDERRAMSAKILTSQGRWVTRSDDKGLVLVWPQSSGYLPALDAKGKPISYSWAALQSAGQKRHKPAEEDIAIGQTMGN